MSSGRLKTSRYLAYLKYELCLSNMIQQRKDKNILLESTLELLGNVSVVLWLPHNLTDQSLLAVQVIVVELLVQLLEEGDPLDDIQGVEVITISGRSKMGKVGKEGGKRGKNIN